MAKTIAIVNQKGGVGKTTTCVNLAAALTEAGQRILLCDFDPQANSTSGMGVDKTVSKGIYDALIGEVPVEDALVHTKYGDVLPSNKALAGAGIELIGMERREFLLRDALDKVKDRYDFLFIDCPPSLELLTLNALCAADAILVPVQGEYYALEGLSDLMNTVRIVRRSLNPRLELDGVLLTMFDGRTNLALQVAEEVKHYFPGKVYATVIPRNVRLSEAPSHGKPITAYDRTSRGAEAYTAFAAEFLKSKAPDSLERSVPMASKKPSGLGRGLGALLGDDVLKAESTGSLYLPISQVESCSSQPRKHFDEASLAELADSIREHGIIQPLTVRKLASGYYQIIAGERRWRAARLAGLQEVPVIVMEADDRKAAELAMIENLQREDLNPIEEAAGFQSLMETYHMTQEEAASRVGKSRSAVANALRLLSLTPPVAKLVEEGKLSAGHARALLPLSPALQENAAGAVISGGLSVRQTEALAKRLSLEKPEKAPAPKGIDYAAEAQKELSSKLGRGVRIVTGRKKGRIELEYYGIDDLNDLLEALAMLRAKQTKTP